MRISRLKAGAVVLAAILAVGAAPQASAQQQSHSTSKDGRPEAKPAPAGRLDALLKLYEQRRRNRRDMRGRVVETRKDRTFGQTVVRHGDVLFKSPDLFRLDLSDSQGQPESIWVHTGKEVRHYFFPQKTVYVAKITPTRARALDAKLEGWRVFLGAALLGQWAKDAYLGLPADKLKARYELRLIKEDKHWAYIEMQPPTEQVRAEMTRAQLVLSQETHQIRRLWLEYSNQSEATWDFAEVRVNVDPPVSKASILRGLPSGWQEMTFGPDLKLLDTKGMDQTDR
jgi:hypothetical protein